jgi:hypothetical protein
MTAFVEKPIVRPDPNRWRERLPSTQRSYASETVRQNTNGSEPIFETKRQSYTSQLSGHILPVSDTI